MSRATGVLTILGAVFLAAVTLQPQPFSVGMTDRRDLAQQKSNQQPTPELVERWLEVAEEVDPAKARRLREMCHHDPEEFNRVMRQTGRAIIGLAELKSEDPELYRLKLGELRIEAQVEVATAALTEAIRSGDPAAVSAREEDLRRWIRMQVLHSIKARGDYLLRLKQHVQRLEEELAYEAENFEQTVDKRFHEIVTRSQPVAAGER